MVKNNVYMILFYSIHKFNGSMFILCPFNGVEKKLLQSKIRKASGIGNSIENPTNKRDASTSTEDIGMYYF